MKIHAKKVRPVVRGHLLPWLGKAPVRERFLLFGSPLSLNGCHSNLSRWWKHSADSCHVILLSTKYKVSLFNTLNHVQLRTYVLVLRCLQQNYLVRHAIIMPCGTHSSRSASSALSRSRGQIGHLWAVPTVIIRHIPTAARTGSSFYSIRRYKGIASEWKRYLIVLHLKLDLLIWRAAIEIRPPLILPTSFHLCITLFFLTAFSGPNYSLSTIDWLSIWSADFNEFEQPVSGQAMKSRFAISWPSRIEIIGSLAEKESFFSFPHTNLPFLFFFFFSPPPNPFATWANLPYAMLHVNKRTYESKKIPNELLNQIWKISLLTWTASQ